jgi:hypothetical protein
MNSKIDNSEKIFRTVLAIVCLVIGTLLSITSIIISFVPLVLGLLIALTGLILFLVDALFS